MTEEKIIWKCNSCGKEYPLCMIMASIEDFPTLCPWRGVSSWERASCKDILNWEKKAGIE
jgi:hypothetical protein